MKRRLFLAQASAASATLALAPAAQAAYRGPSVVIGWNKVLTAAIAANALGPTVAARAISMVYEAVYNAWAAYDWRADFTLKGLKKQPWREADEAWQSIAVSNAAATVLLDLFPAQAATITQALADLTDDLPTWQHFADKAAKKGEKAGKLLLKARHDDGSNQDRGNKPWRTIRRRANQRGAPGSKCSRRGSAARAELRARRQRGTARRAAAGTKWRTACGAEFSAGGGSATGAGR